jgi:hypothetical protein
VTFARDRDWIPDAIERAVGLDPTRGDSDGDGVSDDDEDTSGDGIRNGLMWAIVADPSHVLAHYANVDPAREGFRVERDFAGAPAPPTTTHPRAWRVTADPQGFYYHRLTTIQKQRAVNNGWRLLSCGALWTGVAFVDVDLTPLGPRYDQGFLVAGSRLSLFLATGVAPRTAEFLDLGTAGAWPPTEYVFVPGQGARVTVSHHRRTGFRGHSQFQEDYGVFFGASDDVGTAPRGEGDFSLVLLQIR